MTAAARAGIEPRTSRRLGRLRTYNLGMGLFHALQGLVILALSNDFSLSVTGTFMQGPPGSGLGDTKELFSIRVGPAVAVFVFISALTHFTIASPRVYGWYCRNLMRGRNYARWIEYFFSASIMVVIIAMFTGISDVAALGAIFGVNASMLLFGLLMEHYETPGKANWMAFWFGVFAGAIPWAMIAIYLVSPTVQADPPGFVYGIFFSLFVFFSCFAVNMALQYKRIGPWRDYLFGEAVYVLLSLAAKSALAWQIFASTLID